MKMPFGKYKNISLEFINSGYLKWLLQQDWFLNNYDDHLIICVEMELNVRDLDGSHFYEDKVKL